MKIEIQNFVIETNEHGGFNLLELRKCNDRKTQTEKLKKDVIAYGLSLPQAISRIVHMNLHQNPNIVSLEQFMVEYKNEYAKILKLLEVAKLK